MELNMSSYDFSMNSVHYSIKISIFIINIILNIWHMIVNCTLYFKLTEKQMAAAVKVVRNVCQPKTKATSGKLYFAKMNNQKG